MSIVDICPECGAANETGVVYCGTCAAPMAPTPLARRGVMLPQRWEPRSALVTMSATLLAWRIGGRLIRFALHRWQQRHGDITPPPRQAVSRPHRFRIRRRWVWGNASGLCEWGEEEITLEPNE